MIPVGLGVVDRQARRERADLSSFDVLMKRKGGQPPRSGDER